MLSYPINIKKRGHTVTVTSPDFPEICLDCGDRAVAVEEATSALQTAIARRIGALTDIPDPSAGDERAILPTQTAMKVRLYQALRRRGVSKRELGRRLHWHGPQVDRLFFVNHSSRIDQLEAAFSALGLQLSVDVVGVAER